MELKAIMRLFSNNDEVRLYRPILKRIAGSTNAAIFLSQLIYWSNINDHKWFYKFNGPCSHEDYREGDSWEEELLFSRKEVLTVKKNIVMTVGDTTKNKYLKEYGEDLYLEKLQHDIDNALVISYQTPNRLTYYKVNMVKINKLLSKLYAEQDKLKHSKSLENQLNTDWGFSFSQEPKQESEDSQEVESGSSSGGQQNQLSTKKGFSKVPQGDLDHNKEYTKNNKDPKGAVSLSEEKKEKVKTALLAAMRLIPVSKAVSKKGVSAIYLINELYPLASKRGVDNVINALKTIKAEANENPINDLTALIISKL